MRRGDIIWGTLLVGISGLLVFPATHALFVDTTRAHPYLMGFLKVSILASMGELLARRITRHNWDFPVGMPWRVVVWGGIGMSFVAVFELFASGTTALINKSLLPTLTGETGNRLAQAFWTSTLMNILFAPGFMAFHRLTDGFIEEGHGTWAGIRSATLHAVMQKQDWSGFVGFVLLRTIPLFWIPAHTITFLLAPEYRVLMASYLSIALGGILAFARLRTAPAQTSA
ncbi:MAG TPA: hypothetical protein PKO06_18565 [Candidatus Ozemobacteraceae bacterium]|nr:hypothetical protein [Candidatus Ozemobacteraceae bacterium]